MTSRPPRRRRRRRPLGAEPLEGVGDFVPGEHCASRERSSSGSMSGPAALDPSRATGGTSHESVDKVRLPRAIRVKNKAPAGVQITAEQILREAREMQEAEGGPKVPKQNITDPEELAEYRMSKRKEFEDVIRRNRTAIGVWVKYAKWEESQRDFERARSVYERALDIEYQNHSLWLKYAEMEMRHRQINHARNIWDRCTALLPRVDQFWYKYAFMEEMLGNISGARQVFERWLEWMPDDSAYLAYVKMELRYDEVDRCRNIFNRYVESHNSVRAWIRYARFEEKSGEVPRSRQVFEKGMEVLEEDANDETFFMAFAKFEERCKEWDRARVIYKYALDNLAKSEAQELYKTYISFEKQHGDREGIEDVIVGKRRFQYESELQKNPRNYDVWFDYIRLEESHGELEKIRDTYERAISNLPPVKEKKVWRRYIYLWINYALFEELEAEDAEKCREVYKQCLRIIPHGKFSFSKIWTMCANFEIRQQNLDAARSVFGNAMGRAPKPKVFEAYIYMEQLLGNMDRCRVIYEKYLQFDPSNVAAWIKFTELEHSLGELDRSRAIFELAVNQPLLDMPEMLWKSYIDFEISEEEYGRVRELYARLLERTKHVKVYISYAQFESAAGEIEKARAVFEMANAHFKRAGAEHKEERVVLIESWRDFEDSFGDEGQQSVPAKLMPKRVKRKRAIENEAGEAAGWEEYYDHIFPDEETTSANLKILEMARKWKKQKADDD